MVALADEQAEHNLTQSLFVTRLDLEEAHAHRRGANRGHHRRFDGDRFFSRCRLQAQLEKCPSCQFGRRPQCAPPHRNLGDPICGPQITIRQELRLDGGRETFVLPSIEGLCVLAGTGPKRTEPIGTELAPEGKDIHAAQDTFNRALPRGGAHERCPAVRTVQLLHEVEGTP